MQPKKTLWTFDKAFRLFTVLNESFERLVLIKVLVAARGGEIAQ